MNKTLFFLLFLETLINADITKKMYQLYQNGAYLESCTIGRASFTSMQHNESFVSLYAFSCLKSDQIDRLNGPIMALNQSTEARTNASYFSMLVMQKKLLLQALYDNRKFKTLIFPTSSHLLSKVFSLYMKDSQVSSPIKTYSDTINPRQSYKLYPIDTNGHKTFAIDEFYDNILTTHHIYE